MVCTCFKHTKILVKPYLSCLRWFLRANKPSIISEFYYGAFELWEAIMSHEGMLENLLMLTPYEYLVYISFIPSGLR